MKTTVVNIKAGEQCDVICTRPSKWGNPFIIGRDGNRAEVLRKFRNYMRSSPLMTMLSEIRGKRLGCVCAPADCHCDVLAELADAH